MQPIKPSEVVGIKPAAVIEVFNELIQRYWNGKYAIVLQEEAIRMIMDRLVVSRSTVLDRQYLDIESVYREAGWVVEYSKKGLTTAYGLEEPAKFIFSVKK